jgi:hypothetical protein
MLVRAKVQNELGVEEKIITRLWRGRKCIDPRQIDKYELLYSCSFRGSPVKVRLLKLTLWGNEDFMTSRLEGVKVLPKHE